MYIAAYVHTRANERFPGHWGMAYIRTHMNARIHTSSGYICIHIYICTRTHTCCRRCSKPACWAIWQNGRVGENASDLWVTLFYCAMMRLYVHACMSYTQHIEYVFDTNMNIEENINPRCEQLSLCPARLVLLSSRTAPIWDFWDFCGTREQNLTIVFVFPKTKCY